jgi:hypothetical protein
MRLHFKVKFVWAAVLLSPFLVAGGGPVFAAQGANNDVRVCNYQAGKEWHGSGSTQAQSGRAEKRVTKERPAIDESVANASGWVSLRAWLSDARL